MSLIKVGEEASALPISPLYFWWPGLPLCLSWDQAEGNDSITAELVWPEHSCPDCSPECLPVHTPALRTEGSARFHFQNHLWGRRHCTCKGENLKPSLSVLPVQQRGTTNPATFVQPQIMPLPRTWSWQTLWSLWPQFCYLKTGDVAYMLQGVVRLNGTDACIAI